MTSWLHKQRKGELQSLADRAGLKHDSLLKEDLVTALDEHLRQNATALSSDKTFAEYYQRGASPVKKPRTSASADPSGDAPAKRRRTISVKKDPEAAGGAESTSLIPSTPAAMQSLASRVRLPASPAVIADAFDAQTARLNSKVSALVKKSGIKKKVSEARLYLSDVATIQLLVLFTEAFGLRREVLPFVPWTVATGKQMGVSEATFYVPNAFILATREFWAPTTLWLTTSLFVPLLFSYFFNLTFTNPKMKSRRAAPLRQYDPLTFSIVKGLASWLVYSQGFNFWGLFANSTTAVVSGNLYGGYEAMMIGSAIGVLTSLYDHLSFKS